MIYQMSFTSWERFKETLPDSEYGLYAVENVEEALLDEYGLSPMGTFYRKQDEEYYDYAVISEQKLLLFVLKFG